MDYNTERFQLRCAVCGKTTMVQRLDEPALCDKHTRADLREMKREAHKTRGVDGILRENRRL